MQCGLWEAPMFHTLCSNLLTKHHFKRCPVHHFQSHLTSYCKQNCTLRCACMTVSYLRWAFYRGIPHRNGTPMSPRNALFGWFSKYLTMLLLITGRNIGHNAAERDTCSPETAGEEVGPFGVECLFRQMPLFPSLIGCFLSVCRPLQQGHVRVSPQVNIDRSKGGHCTTWLKLHPQQLLALRSVKKLWCKIFGLQQSPLSTNGKCRIILDNNDGQGHRWRGCCQEIVKRMWKPLFPQNAHCCGNPPPSPGPLSSVTTLPLHLMSILVFR